MPRPERRLYSWPHQSYPRRVSAVACRRRATTGSRRCCASYSCPAIIHPSQKRSILRMFRRVRIGVHMFRTSLVAALLLLSACNKSDGASATPPAPESVNDVELIQRDALFGNPERVNVQISPDGKHLSWVAPLDGVQNVWVAPVGDLEAARAVTADEARGIRSYLWTYRPDTLLYMRDTGGDEDFHVYVVDLQSGESKDLSPYPKTRASVVAASHLHPES